MFITFAARRLGTTVETLRAVDRSGAFKPRRDEWGRRMYAESDLPVLRRILASRKPGRPKKVRAQAPVVETVAPLGAKRSE
jgi:DNA-binding transcriptional MerR regulator